MKIIKKDCFAYRDDNLIDGKLKKEYCFALKELKCENCKFYKRKDCLK